ncbi:MAG: DUF2071 domain-containing protein [Planctomycetales bacterium]|nr:DUF2071 domain-containing protein [Planctomycetales bacterium]
MRIPTIRGTIDRRILANFRIDPDVLAKILPSPFRPQTVNGFGIAGICLIRLKHIRPKNFPAWVGISSENAAHRIAVEWDADGELCSGVYIPRRDTSSLLNALAGGRVFPGEYHRATFEVYETETAYRIEMNSLDSTAHVLVDGQVATSLAPDSVFSSVADASQFFAAGSLGYSPAGERAGFDGLELTTFDWRVEPLQVTSLESSFFDNAGVFPPGTVEFDNALLMRGIEHEWLSRDSLCCESAHARANFAN